MKAAFGRETGVGPDLIAGVQRHAQGRTPWAMTGGGTGLDPHPATSSATTAAAPAAARSSFFMRIRRRAARAWLHAEGYATVKLL